MRNAVSNNQTIVVIDDDESIRQATGSLLRSLGFHVAPFVSAEAFVAAEPIGDAVCMIVDVCMPGMSGLDLQRYLVAAGRSLPIIFISAHDLPAVRQQAISDGALAFIGKPFIEKSLIDAVQLALNDPPQVCPYAR